MTFDDLKRLAGFTLREPQAAARVLIDSNLPMSVRWMALILMVVLSSLLAWFSSLLLPGPAAEQQAGVSALVAQPFVLAMMQLGGLILGATLMASVGRIFGGQGRFEDALLLTVWIEVLLMVVQVLQIILMLILPGLASMLGIVSVALFLWLTVQFTKELHGFESGFKVALGMLGTLLVAGFLFSLIAASFGLMPEISQ